MIRIEVKNGAAVVARIGTELPKEVRAGAAEGIRTATADLAADIAAHTPTKSGRAKASVHGRMRERLTGVVEFGTDEAFYFRFVVWGAKAHEIVPRGNKLRNRIAARSAASMSRRGLYAALVAAGVDGARLAEVRGSGSRRGRPAGSSALGYMKLALSINGKPYGRARHPGIRASLLLTKRLEANSQKIAETIRGSIAHAMNREAANGQ